jgi:DNA-binding IclR family transcriptional regulator
MMNSRPADHLISKTLSKGIDVLEVFLAAGGGPLGLTEVSRTLGFDKMTTHRLLVTLAMRGLLSYDPRAEKYALSLRLVQYGAAAQRALPVVDLAAPFLEQLRDLTGETAALAVPDGADRVYAAAALSGQPVRWVVVPGQRAPLYRGASSGYIFAAERPDQKIRALVAARAFEAHGYQPEDGEVMEAIREARQLGSCTYVHPGIELASISFAIRGAAGKIVAAVAVAGPTGRWGRQRMLEFRDRMAEPVAELEQKLRHQTSAGMLDSDTGAA